MPNFNSVTLIGHASRDPDFKPFANGGGVCNLGIAVSRRRKNSSGQWENYPVWVDCKVFNKGEHGKLADLIRDRVRKGHAILVDGELDLETWTDKTTGQNRSKHTVIVNNVQLLHRDNAEGGQHEPAPAGNDGADDAPPASGASDIPF